MKYISIDCEMTSLSADDGQLLEIGLIIEDSANPLPFDELPKLKLTIEHDQIHGQQYAIWMNARIFELLARAEDIKDNEQRKLFKEQNNIIKEADAAFRIWDFLRTHGFGEGTYDPAVKAKKIQQLKITVAGKNFGTCDKLFLDKLPDIKKYVVFRHRIIDPCTAYIDFENDETPPSMDECFVKLRINHTVSHDSVEDAWDVIRLLRPMYTNFEQRRCHK